MFHSNRSNSTVASECMCLCYNFILKQRHITGSVNRVADFLSRLELKVTEKIRLKIREDIRTTAIEVTTSFFDVADEEQLYLFRADIENDTDEHTLESKNLNLDNRKRMGSKWEVILIENYWQRVHRDWRKHSVVFHDRNQSKCTNMSRAKRRSSNKDFEAQNTGPTPRWSTTDVG